MKTTRHLLFCTLILVWLMGCSRSTVQAPPTPSPTPGAQTEAYWPTRDWRTSTPEAQGMDGQSLAAMLDAIHQQRLDFHSLLVIRHGYLVSETYYSIFDQDTRHELYSCTKSFVSTLIGIALDQGTIDGTGAKVLDFFPGQTFASLDERKQAMTLDDLLTMRSGLDWQEGDPAYRTLSMSEDWPKFMLNLPMEQAPGSAFNYCSGCTHVLSAILRQATGQNPLDFARQNLFEPLGITDYSWSTDAAGIPIGGWGLQLTPREMAKLGYLFLHEGQWDGKQIVSADWVKNATSQHTEATGGLGYGYQWWTIPSLGAYAALGLFGQTILVVPRLDLVVVTTAQLDNHDPIFRLIAQYILPAVK